MALAEVSNKKLNDVVFFGMRLTIGVIFIVHGASKLSEEGYQGFVGWMSSMGIPEGMAILIAFGELIPGILLVVGVLNRISAAILALIMFCVIVIINKLENFTGDFGYEFNLMLLAACLVIAIAGPGRISISHVVKKLPRFIH